MSKQAIGFFAESVPASVKFAGKKVIFEEIMYRYAAAESEFTPAAEKTIRQMESNFDDEIGLLDDFLRKSSEWIYDSLSDLLDFTMDQLSMNGCFSMEKHAFFEQYVVPKIEVIPEIFDKMQDVYNEIAEKQAETNERRVAERRLHVAEGKDELGEMLWNGLKRGKDELVNQGKKAQYYNDDVQNQIKQEFRYLCLTMVDSFAEALWDSEHLDLRCPISGEDYKRTRVMFDNLSANKIPEARMDDVALEIFEKNPIVPGFLPWAVIRYGDADGEMQKIANAFHVSIDETKKKLLKSVFDTLDFSSEKTTLASQETLKAEENRLQYRNDEFNDVIEAHLKEFDVKARTVDKVTYKTREEAAKASELYKYFKKLDLSTEESAKKAKEDFCQEEENTGLNIPKLEQTIDSKLQDFDKAAKTVDGVMYETREKAKNAGMLLALYKTLKFETETEALKSKEIFLAKEQELGMTLSDYEKKISSVLSAMDQNAKTFDGKEFATREEAVEARNQYNELKKMLLDSGFDTLEKIPVLLEKIEKRKFTIPQAVKVKERLLIHQEILKAYPLKNIELLKIMMFPKIKLVTVIVLLTLMAVCSTFAPVLGVLIMLVYFAFLISLFFTTKAGFLKRAKTCEELKKYKMAAICYELAKPKSDPEYIGIEL